jgi:hypothetical protein
MTAALYDGAVDFAAASWELRSAGGGVSGSAVGDPPGHPTDVRVLLGQAIRKLKQHWQLGEAMRARSDALRRVGDVRGHVPAAHPHVPPVPLYSTLCVGRTPHVLRGAGVVLSTLLDMPSAVALDAHGKPAAPPAGEGAGGAAADELGSTAAAARLEAARALLTAVEGYGLAECWSWKPLLDGKQVGRGKRACLDLFALTERASACFRR